MDDPSDRPDPRQMEVLRRMTPGQRVRIAMRLGTESRRIKAAALRSFHPDWSEERIRQAVREAFLNART